MGTSQYIRQILTTIKRKIDTIIVGDFNTPLIPMDRSSRQEINKEKQALNDTLDQLELQGISPTTNGFHFFPALGDEVPTTGTPEKSLSFPFHSCHPISLLFSPSVLSLDSWFPCDDLLTGHVISGPSSLEWVIHSPLSPTPSPYPRIYLHHFWYFFYIYKWAMTTCSVWAGELRREGWKPTYNGVFVCTTLTYFCLSDCFYLPNCHPDPSLYIPVEQCLIISSLL